MLIANLFALWLADDYIAGCSTACQQEEECIAFWVSTTEAEKGLCCLYESYSDITS